MKGEGKGEDGERRGGERGSRRLRLKSMWRDGGGRDRSCVDSE